MSYYTMRNALLATLAGGMPIGGMAAQMQNPRAPENDAKALRDIWFDKLRERLTGLIRIDGTLHDTYRQSWVATVAARLRRGGPRAARDRRRRSAARRRQADAGRTRPARRRSGCSKDGRIRPLELTAADLTVEKLFSDEARERLLARPQGPTTEDGLRYAMYMATEFMYQQLQGNNAAAIYDPRTGLRFMNDLGDLRDLLALPLSHRLPRRRAHGRRPDDEEGRSRHAGAVRAAARRAPRDGEGALQDARRRLRADERGAGAAGAASGRWCDGAGRAAGAAAAAGSSTDRACCSRSSSSPRRIGPRSSTRSSATVRTWSRSWPRAGDPATRARLEKALQAPRLRLRHTPRPGARIGRSVRRFRRFDGSTVRTFDGRSERSACSIAGDRSRHAGWCTD